MYHGTRIKMQKKESKEKDPADSLSEIKSASHAIKAVQRFKNAPPEVQEKVHAHIKEHFPDVLLERRR